MFKFWMMWLMLAFAGLSCGDFNDFNHDAESNVTESHYNTKQAALTATDHKLPLSKDYAWGISQSWGSHCKDCDQAYPYNQADPNDMPYCDDKSSHTWEDTYYGWDFYYSKYVNGKQENASGKPALASSDGTVKIIDNVCPEKKGWGCYVIIDHGNNVCTRYAHLTEGSVAVHEGQILCQGFKVGEIGKSGNAGGPHLHFQFQDCNNEAPIERGFGADASYIPKCLKGDTQIAANPLKLDNLERGTCGWKEGACKKVSGCPLNSSCGNAGKQPNFGDQAKIPERQAVAIKYLWRECVASGKSDGKFYPNDSLSRAEALKIAMELAGLKCTGNLTEPFSDVKSSDWFYPYVTCGISKNLITTTGKIQFFPNQYVTYAEAAKFLVEAAVKGNLLPTMENVPETPFKFLAKDHWAYPYMSTIFVKGGIGFSMTQDMAKYVTRGEYAVMAAALSPCFEHSVKCSDNCKFNPDNYTCEMVVTQDPPVVPPPAGGASGADVWSFGAVSYSDVKSNDVTGCTPNCNGKTCGSDGCGGSCGTCTQTGYSCVNNVCKKPCNPPTCASKGLSCGGISYYIDDSCWGDVECGTCPTGQSCTDGKCIDSNSSNSNWTCDPAKGYTLKISSPNGTWKAMTSGPTAGTYSGKLPAAGNKLNLHVECNELPVIVLVNSGANTSISAWLEDASLPPFSAWVEYYSPLVMDPSIPATTVTPNLTHSGATAGVQVLVKVQAGKNTPAPGPVSPSVPVPVKPPPPPPPPPPCVPNCSGKTCGLDGCGGSCGTCASGYNCVSDICKKICVPPTCTGLGVVCGSKIYDYGEGCAGTLSCGSCAADQVCDSVGKCQAKPPSNGWVCDPAKGYSLYVYAPKGNWQALTKGAVGSLWGSFSTDTSKMDKIKFECSELPAVLLIKTNAPSKISDLAVWSEYPLLDKFDAWSQYSSWISINPTSTPTHKGVNYISPIPSYSNILVRVPAM
ncbi:MAG: peptidoglycan DD-metalloendopeptidase family protein [Patescibacteria group bacterium]|mgnify:FL=1